MSPKIPDADPDGSPPGPREIDLSKLALHSIHDRHHLSEVQACAGTPQAGTSFVDWFASLPGFLGAERLRAAVDAIVRARQADRPVAMAMGGHVIKMGCTPIVIDLMRRGIVTAIAGNGATAIHDVELAMVGATSEDVGDTIRDGRFGMVRETAEFFAAAAERATREKIGFGAAIGQSIRGNKLPHCGQSVFAVAAELNIPATVHIAIGTDTIHMPAEADGARLGEASLRDFRIICAVVEQMASERPDASAGVWCNVGSAVVLPEVFLKAVSIARNLGADLDNLTTVNLDQLRHYRPARNVVGRPVARGRGHDISGHHEILLPVIRQAIVERMDGAG